ncbi:MAG: chorismate mutase [bacterium]
MNELEQYRKQIDAIDEEMIALFESRMHCVREIIAYKIENQMEIFQQGREEAVLAHALSVLRDQDLAPYLKAFLINTMNLSKAYQASLLPSEPMSYPQPRQGNLLIGYQGVPGSFSSHAVKTYFGDVGMQDYDHFADVFQALLEDRIDYGVLPLENSTTGAINDNYDLITSYGFYITSEISCPIDQYLLGIKGADLSTIKEVYSHPQALLQTGRFLDAHHIKKYPHEDTAGAAADIARKQDPACGAIASLEAGAFFFRNSLSSFSMSSICLRSSFSPKPDSEMEDDSCTSFCEG